MERKSVLFKAVRLIELILCHSILDMEHAGPITLNVRQKYCFVLIQEKTVDVEREF